MVKLIVEKLKESSGVGWREEYDALLKKYGLKEAEEKESEVSSSLEEGLR